MHAKKKEKKTKNVKYRRRKKNGEAESHRKYKRIMRAPFVHAASSYSIRI